MTSVFAGRIGRMLKPSSRTGALLQTAVSQGGILGLNFATGILTSRFLGAQGRGDFAAITLWLLFPSLFATAGLQSALLYETRGEAARRPAALSATLLLSTSVFVPLALLCLPVMALVLRHYPHRVMVAAVAGMAFSVVNVWVVIVRNGLLGARSYGNFNAFNICFALLYLLGLVGLAACHEMTPVTALCAQMIGTAATLAAWAPPLIGDLLRTTRAELRDGIRRIAAYGWRAAPQEVLSAIASGLDGLVLVAVVSPQQVGLYAVAASFARILILMQTAVSGVLLADLVGRSPREIEVFLHRAFRLLFGALVICGMLLLLVDRTLLMAVYGRDFGAATPIFRVLLLDAALTCLSGLLAPVFLAVGMPERSSKAQIVSFVVTALGLAVAVPVLGAVGAGLARALGSLVRVGLMLADLKGTGIALPSLAFCRADLAPVLRLLPIGARR